MGASVVENPNRHKKRSSEDQTKFKNNFGTTKIYRNICNITNEYQPKTPSYSFKKPIFEWIFQSSQSQALLYRMTSGDSNHIHVDNSASDMLGSDTKAPLLHGLFTLALVYRAVIKLIDGGCNSFDIGDDFNVIFRRLEGKFKAPAYVGDCLCVKIWNGMKVADTKNFVFVVTNHVTGQTLLDCGYAEVEIISQLFSTKKSRMRSIHTIHRIIWSFMNHKK